MKKLLPALLLSLLFGLFGGSSFAATQPVKPNQPRVILDQLLTGPVPALNAKDLNIPPDLAPGFHELTVQRLRCFVKIFTVSCILTISAQI